MSDTPEHIIGSIILDRGPQPFVLNLTTGTLEVGTYARPDAAQATLSIIQQQRFAQLIHERTNVSFAQVRMGQYFCTQCRQWIEATPEAWGESAVCRSCDGSGGARVELRQPDADSSSVGVEELPEVDAAPDERPGLDVLTDGASAPLLEKAIVLAATAHRGQVDKAGAPYILHPLRMMLTMHTPAEMMAAVLHDVVEDTAWTLEALRAEGFPDEVVEAVGGLTRREDESYEAFIERAAQHPLARRVKLADLEDNMDLRRLARLTDADQARLVRYQRAWRRLMEERSEGNSGGGERRAESEGRRGAADVEE